MYVSMKPIRNDSIFVTFELLLLVVIVCKPEFAKNTSYNGDEF